MRSQRAGDCWKPVRIPDGMGLGAESETTDECGSCLIRIGPILSDCSPLMELKVLQAVIAIRIRVVPRLSRPLRRKAFFVFKNRVMYQIMRSVFK